MAEDEDLLEELRAGDPGFIDWMLQIEESWTPERVKREMPFAAPRLEGDRG